MTFLKYKVAARKNCKKMWKAIEEREKLIVEEVKVREKKSVYLLE